MSKPTPRKGRHARHPSNRIPAVSDYESDAAAIAKSYEPPAPRTNTELNLSVLRRYLPSIRTILSIAANAVVYTIPDGSEQWEKTGIEGTTFVCAQAPAPEDASQNPRACVFVLNRRGLDNVVVDLATVTHVEMNQELLILRVAAADGEGSGSRWLGLWIHNDQAETRNVNFAMVQEAWKIARANSTTALAEGQGAEVGPAMQAMGRRLSLGELFTKQDNAVAGA